jgi:methionyl-tRNA formyltransferase
LQVKEGLRRSPQSDIGITYAEKILKSESELDWSAGAKELDCRIRAFNPFPGATSTIDGQLVKVWNSKLSSPQTPLAGKPGEILGFSDCGVYVQSGNGVLEVLEMQKPGGKRMDAKTCLQTFHAAEKLFFS